VVQHLNSVLLTPIIRMELWREWFAQSLKGQEQ
jgi:hypothetical protein